MHIKDTQHFPKVSECVDCSSLSSTIRLPGYIKFALLIRKSCHKALRKVDNEIKLASLQRSRSQNLDLLSYNFFL